MLCKVNSEALLLVFFCLQIPLGLMFHLMKWNVYISLHQNIFCGQYINTAFTSSPCYCQSKYTGINHVFAHKRLNAHCNYNEACMSMYL